MTRYIIGWAIWILALAGCAGAGPRPGIQTPLSLGRGIPAITAPQDPHPPTPVVLEEPTGEITLSQALALALLHNPDLGAYSWEIRVREAEALQAGLRPNPEIGVEIENFAGSGPWGGLGGSETTVSLSQLIELGGKRAKRLGLGDLDRNLAIWDYENRRVAVFTEVTRAFVSILAEQQRVVISQDLVAVAEQSLDTVSRRVRAGAVSSVEETRSRVALSTSRLHEQAARRQLDSAGRRLASLWGVATPRFTGAVGSLEGADEPPSLDHLLPQAEQAPQVARWITEIERRRADLALQRALGTPNVTVMGGFRHLTETSDNAFVLGVGVPLPFTDRNQGTSRAAEYRVAKAGEEQRAALVDTRTSLAVIHEIWSAAYDEITTLDREILPDAELALETAQDAYQRGLLRLTDVLDTQRTLFQLRSQRIDALERYHHARADLEHLIGASLGDDGRSQ